MSINSLKAIDTRQDWFNIVSLVNIGAHFIKDD